MRRIHMVLLVSVFAGIFFAPPVFADSIVLVADQYPPYNESPDSKAPGYAVEIMQRVFGKAGHDVIYQIVPWARAIVEARKGTYTAIIAALRSDAPDFVFPRAEIGVAKYCFYVRPGDPWRYSGIDSLAGKKIGVVNAYSYTPRIDAFFLGNPQVQPAAGDDPVARNIEKLTAGRVDTFIENAAVISALFHGELLSERIVEAGCQMDEIGLLYIAFSPNIPMAQEYADILSDGIDALRASGELQEILSRYGQTDWKQDF